MPSPRGQYSGKIRFIEKRGVQDEGCRHVAKRSSDHRKALPEVKLQGRDLVRVVVLLSPLPHWDPIRGEIRFIEPQGGNWSRRLVSGAPSSGTPRESQANFRIGTMWGL